MPVVGSRGPQGELVRLQEELFDEVQKDSSAIAPHIFGDVDNQPDLGSVPNARLDAIYRQAYQRNDREFLQREARRDPQQFLKVTQRLGVTNAPPGTVVQPNALAQAMAQPQAQVPMLPPGGALPAAPLPPVAPPTLPNAPLVPGVPGGQPIPMLAQGGIVTEPTLAVIGEAGPEAVVPLSEQARDKWAPTAPGQSQVGWGPSNFVTSLRPLATQAEANTGIPANLYLAMAANETGWGRSQTAQQNNLFSVQGSGANGQRWATYESPLESFQSFADLISTSPRYAQAWAVREDPAAFLNELRKAGYVVDEPGYPSAAWVRQVSSIYRDLAEG